MYLRGDKRDGAASWFKGCASSFISLWIQLAWGRLLIWFNLTFVPFSLWKSMLTTKPSWPCTGLCRYISSTPYTYLINGVNLIIILVMQHYIKLSESEKNRKLNDLLDALDFNQVVIFVKSVSRAAELNKLLAECNFPSICIHSGMSQEERLVLTLNFCDFDWLVSLSN